MNDFWSKVRRGDVGECWPYIGCINRRSGYGSVSVGTNKSKGAHVMAFVLSGGELTEEKTMVLHSCDNPPCCNPNHLRAGDQRDNVRDAVSRGRHISPLAGRPHLAARGSRHGKALLTEEIVAKIKIMRAKGATQKHLANTFGVSPGAIQRIVDGTSWKHVEAVTP
jgi:HNH endonuclease